jgi:hypothetical protein
MQSGADRASKSWSWSPTMKSAYREKSAWLAAGLRITFLGLITLLLLPALSPGHSAWPAGAPPTLPQGASQVRPGDFSPPGFRSVAAGQDNFGRHPARDQVVRRPASHFHQNLAVLPAASIWRPSLSPLPPASAFPLQTNLRMYLETWPTPGSTTAEAWPEYVPEDGEDVD